MKILGIGRPRPGTTQEKMMAMLKDEAMAGWQQYAAGTFREVYLRPDGGGAVVILECADTAAAKKIFDALPMVKAGLTEFEIIPLGPFLAFGALFAQS